MFRSIASVGRSALRTGAFSSRQTMIAANAEQPAFFNALRAFSDDAAAGRSKGVVKWFGELLYLSAVLAISSKDTTFNTDRSVSAKKVNLDVFRNGDELFVLNLACRLFSSAVRMYIYLI